MSSSSVDNSSLRKIVSIIFPRMKIVEVTELVTFANKTFKVELDEQTIYCKLYTDDASAARKTVLIYNLFREHGIPCPEVLYSDLDGTYCAYPLIVLSGLQGTNLSTIQYSWDKSALVPIYQQFGTLTAKIHSIIFDRFGEPVEEHGAIVPGPINHNQGPFVTWNAMMRVVHQNRVDFLKGTKLEHLVDPIIRFSELFLNKEVLITPRLCHGDLNSKNILVDRGVISGIIDVDEVFIGNCEEDLMRIELNHFADSSSSPIKTAFFNAYHVSIALDAGYNQRRRFFYISRNLIWVRLLFELGSKISDDPELELDTLGSHLLDVVEGADF